MTQLKYFAVEQGGFLKVLRLKAPCNLRSGVIEWSHGVEPCRSWVLEWSFGVEWSQVLSFCHPSRTGFYDCPTDSDGV